jgi:hypothetical protein
MNTKFYLKGFINSMLTEALERHAANRAEFIKKKIEPIWDKLPGHPGLPGYNDIDLWLEKLAEVDPTQKKIYMPWLATLTVKNPNENKMEDIERVGEDLRAFEANKARITNKDINEYKSFQDLFDVIAPFLKPKEKTKDDLAKDKENERLAAIKSQIVTVYQGPEGWIRIPKTIEAAKFLGQNTRWCTAAEKNNYFDHYNKSDVLFVIYNKADKTRTQLHIDSGQFADEADRNIGMTKVHEWAWDPIIEWYKKNNPNLSIKQLMTLNPYNKGDSLAKGGPHEELLDLMKQYGL